MINQSEISSKFSADTLAFQGAISDKTSLVIYTISMGVTGLTIAFIKGWLLTLVLFGVLPLIIGSMCFYVYNINYKERKEKEAYNKAGGRAEQALSSIKTIKILNGE